ncbi:hypothetical protein RSAG8_12695, partial [Rhizoctonia solani AG-8 WAC10335]
MKRHSLTKILQRVRRASGIELSESDAPESENSSEVEDNEGDDETNEGDETSDHNGDEIEDEDPGRQASASIRAGSSGSQANPSSNQPADAVLQTQRAMVGIDSPNRNLDAGNKPHFRPFIGMYDIWEHSFKDVGLMAEHNAVLQTQRAMVGVDSPNRNLDAGNKPHFRPFVGTYDIWERSFKDVGLMAEHSWAECDLTELERRQEAIPEIVRDFFEVLHYCTGYELYATGTILFKERGSKFETTTPRSQHFCELPAGTSARDSFNQFVTSYIGPNMCTNVDCPAPAVYPDPLRHEHPTFPTGLEVNHEQRQRLLGDYLSYKMAWQGGGTHVPYDLLAQQFQEGSQDIVDSNVLPTAVPYLKDPMLMNPTELGAMISHVVSGDLNKIPFDRQFRFEQFAPGRFASDYVDGRQPGANLVYRPDSQAYVMALAKNAPGISAPREDGLPLIDELDGYCQPFPEEMIMTYRGILRVEDSWWSLLVAVQEHDKLYPPLVTESNAFLIAISNNTQATDIHWDTMSAQMPHLLSQRPMPSSAGDHLVSDGSWLPKEYFDWRGINHGLWGLLGTLQYCQPAKWRHQASGTILGGMFGIKWPVVVLGHLRHNIHRYLEKRDRWVAHYASAMMEVGTGVYFSFENAHIQQVDAAIRILGETRPMGRPLCLRNDGSGHRSLFLLRERPYSTGGCGHSLRNAIAAHSNIPTDPAQFGTVYPSREDDPWDVSLSEVEGAPSDKEIEEVADTGIAGAEERGGSAEIVDSAEVVDSAEGVSSVVTAGTSTVRPRPAKRAASSEQIIRRNARRRVVSESSAESGSRDDPKGKKVARGGEKLGVQGERPSSIARKTPSKRSSAGKTARGSRDDPKGKKVARGGEKLGVQGERPSSIARKTPSKRSSTGKTARKR